MTRQQAKKHIEESGAAGWLNLVDIVYENKPDEIYITEIFQKWAGLKVRFEGEDEYFQELVDNVYYISQKMCERCGKSG